MGYRNTNNSTKHPLLTEDFINLTAIANILQTQDYLHESIPMGKVIVCLELQKSPLHLLPDTGHDQESLIKTKRKHNIMFQKKEKIF